MVESNKGPIKIILIGDIIVDTAFFHAIGDAVPRKESGCLGKPRGPIDPKSDVVMKRKANPEMMNRITNFFLEIFIYVHPNLVLIVCQYIFIVIF